MTLPTGSRTRLLWLGFTSATVSVAAAIQWWRSDSLAWLVTALGVCGFSAGAVILACGLRRGVGVLSLIFPLPVLAFCLLRLPHASDQDSRHPVVNRMMGIGEGLFAYEQHYGHLPGAGGPGDLSWRVAICPYIEQNALFQQFHRDEPWNSQWNLPLVAQRPWLYSSHASDDVPGQTPFQAFVGTGTAFEPGARLRLAKDFPDGVSNTTLFVEMVHPVPWSKPQDTSYGPDIPLPGMGRAFWAEGHAPWYKVRLETGFLMALADGSVRFVHAGVSEETLRAAIVRNDGKQPDWGTPPFDQRDFFPGR